MEDPVQYLLKQVTELSDEERLQFFMKLPNEVTSDELDKDTPTSMSTRSKAAVSWLQCKYEEDKSTSVSKQETYDHYMIDCETAGQLPISGGDFGKIIKMVFPTIYNRRLGQRGQSKYP
ncbi:DNA-binding protein rfx7 [Plakobranchus ocellatus]|uniref:DNA-binding protein rfx7 n=1 Tax=Plakobranchus ocellatus TaxID=259542 RepID=A0AAV4CU89_9GAST|nr:DNA-binding protein rfx7 [Plakobranchus ocellatus]